MIKALLVLGRLRQSGRKCLLPISARPWSAAGLGWLVCTGITSQSDISFQVPSSQWGWLPLYFGGDSASPAAFFQITLYIRCLPESHVFTSCIWFHRGADWLNTANAAVVGLSSFSPPFTLKPSKFIRLQRAQWRSAHLVCKSERGEGPAAALSVQRCVSDEPFSGLCLPGRSSLWVTHPLAAWVTVRCAGSCLRGG